jgi:Cu+-exporting ATPase
MCCANCAGTVTEAAVGVAIGSRTDVAIEVAAVTLMCSDPADVLRAIQVGEDPLEAQTEPVLSVGYNAAMVPLASLGLLRPVLAAEAMALSSVSVLSNSTLVRRCDPDSDCRLFRSLRARLR